MGHLLNQLVFQWDVGVATLFTKTRRAPTAFGADSWLSPRRAAIETRQHGDGQPAVAREDKREILDPHVSHSLDSHTPRKMLPLPTAGCHAGLL